MNSYYESGYRTLISAIIGSVRSSVIFVGALLCTVEVRMAEAANGPETLTSAITLQRPTNSVSTIASGDVVVRWAPTQQAFDVLVKGVRFDEPVDGLGVFLSGEPFDTNSFHFVNVLDGPGTNGTWRLSLKRIVSAPAQLGVSDVRSLAGHYVRITDVATNVYLETFLPPFESNIKSLSYRAQSRMQMPYPAPSPRASGKIRVKLDAPTGASVLDVRARNLSAGNSYCLWIVDFPDEPTEGNCPKTPNLITGQTRFRSDTGKGEQLAVNALVNGDIRIDQYSGRYAEVRDQFGVTHLRGVIP